MSNVQQSLYINSLKAATLFNPNYMRKEMKIIVKCMCLKVTHQKNDLFLVFRYSAMTQTMFRYEVEMFYNKINICKS